LIEATAFGALTIINRFEEYGVKVDEVINCGGIAEKNPLLMQIYADVTGREMKVSRSAQSCALGASIAAAVTSGGYRNFPEAQAAMCGIKKTTYKPIKENHEVYKKLYTLYKQLHDGFGTGPMANVMKQLLSVKELCMKN
jgi:L-ribulokinase